MAPTLEDQPVTIPTSTPPYKTKESTANQPQKPTTFPTPPQLTRLNAQHPSTTCDALVEVLKRDGGVIVENLVSPELVSQIKEDLKPHFDTDKKDESGFFPSTTQRATGLLATSDACVDLALNPLFNAVANATISSTYTYWTGQEQETVTSKPQISSTVGFRVNPGGKQQGLHRDDSDYHTRNEDMPMMIGCVTALTKTTKGMFSLLRSRCVLLPLGPSPVYHNDFEELRGLFGFILKLKAVQGADFVMTPLILDFRNGFLHYYNL
jgi:Phytanoyl-CoA dioxygenase (PhyH)